MAEQDSPEVTPPAPEAAASAPSAAASAPAASAMANAQDQVDCSDLGATMTRIKNNAGLTQLEESAITGGAKSQGLEVAGNLIGGALFGGKLPFGAIGGSMKNSAAKLGNEKMVAAAQQDACGVTVLPLLKPSLPFGLPNILRSQTGK